MRRAATRLCLRLAALTCACAVAPATASALTPSVSYFPAPTLSAGPSGIAAGPDGGLWFTEANAGQIGALSARRQMSEYSTASGLNSPAGIVAGPDGALWFSEAGGCPQAGCAANPRPAVGRTTPASPAAIEELPLPAASTPGALTDGSDGAIWLTDDAENAIWRVDPATRQLSRIDGLPSKHSAGDHGPTGIASGRDGLLWFSLQGRDEIAAMTTGGAMAADYPVPTPAAAPDQLAVGADGLVYFTEAGAAQVGRLDPGTGAIAELPLSAGARATGITRGRDGAVWFGERRSGGAGAIGRVTGDGSVEELPLADPAGAAQPAGIASGPDGNLWFADPATDDIGRITTPPTATTGAAFWQGRGGELVGGTADSHGQRASFHVDYGTGASYGASTPESPLRTASGDQQVSASLSQVAAATSYHYRLVATNGTGKGYGRDATFLTPPGVRTARPRSVRRTSATLRGRLTANGQPTTYRFDYGPTVYYGRSTAPVTRAPQGTIDIAAAVHRLRPGTTYHYRLVASNAGGVAYGADVKLDTPALVSLRSRRASRRWVTVVVSCHAAQDSSCRGRVAVVARARGRGPKLTLLPSPTRMLVAAQAGFNIRGGRRRVLRIRLGPAGRALLTRFARVRLHPVAFCAGGIARAAPLTLRGHPRRPSHRH